MKTVVFEGKEISISEFSKLSGINPTTIKNRLILGWTPDKIASTRPKLHNSMGANGKMSMTDAQRLLDDMPIAAFPEALGAILKAKGYKGRRPGYELRERHRNDFMAWYETIT